MKPIDTLADVACGLEALSIGDEHIRAMRTIAGPVPLRRTPPGFQSLFKIIVGQQVSTAAADAIFARCLVHFDPMTPQQVLIADDDTHRAAGLSRPKQKTLCALATTIVNDNLDLDELCTAPAPEAIAALTSIHGIGEWTAQIYLLFAAGHPDIFPPGDIALQAAVQNALALKARPTEKELKMIARRWAPWRGVAARLCWAYYAAIKGREGVIQSESLPHNSDGV